VRDDPLHVRVDADVLGRPATRDDDADVALGLDLGEREIGLEPSSLTDFGVRLVAGRAYTADAKDEVLLGWRAADNLGKRVGDTLDIAGGPKTVVGIYRTGQAFGDGGAMFPLVFLQAEDRRAGTVTLAFVRVEPGDTAMYEKLGMETRK
jgi:hypothetical protein